MNSVENQMEREVGCSISWDDMVHAENLDILQAMAELGADLLAGDRCGVTPYMLLHRNTEYRSFLHDYAARRFYSAVASCDVSEIKRLRGYVTDRVSAVAVYILLNHKDDECLGDIFSSLGNVDSNMILCEDQITYITGAYPLPEDRRRVNQEGGTTSPQ